MKPNRAESYSLLPEPGNTAECDYVKRLINVNEGTMSPDQRNQNNRIYSTTHGTAVTYEK